MILKSIHLITYHSGHCGEPPGLLCNKALLLVTDYLLDLTSHHSAVLVAQPLWLCHNFLSTPSLWLPQQHATLLPGTLVHSTFPGLASALHLYVLKILLPLPTMLPPKVTFNIVPYLINVARISTSSAHYSSASYHSLSSPEII